jgi:hypothetical protein
VLERAQRLPTKEEGTMTNLKTIDDVRTHLINRINELEILAEQYRIPSGRYKAQPEQARRCEFQSTELVNLLLNIDGPIKAIVIANEMTEHMLGSSGVSKREILDTGHSVAEKIAASVSTADLDQETITTAAEWLYRRALDNGCINSQALADDTQSVVEDVFEQNKLGCKMTLGRLEELSLERWNGDGHNDWHTGGER